MSWPPALSRTVLVSCRAQRFLPLSCRAQRRHPVAAARCAPLAARSLDYARDDKRPVGAEHSYSWPAALVRIRENSHARLILSSRIGCHVYACVDMLRAVIRHAHASVSMAPNIVRRDRPDRPSKQGHCDRTTPHSLSTARKQCPSPPWITSL